MKLQVEVGSTSNIWQIVIDDSSSAVGAGLGSLVYNSAGLVAKYKKAGDTVWSTITLQTITTIGTFESGGGGFKESDSGAVGGYEFQPLDTIVSTEGLVWIDLYGATNMAPVHMEIEVIPKRIRLGTSYKHTQDSFNTANKTADVTITEV